MFNPPNLTGHPMSVPMGGGHGGGNGLQTAMFILNLLKGDEGLDKEYGNELAKPTTSAPVEQRQPAVGPVKYDAFDDTADLRAVSTSGAYDDQKEREIKGSPAVMAYGGRELAPEHGGLALDVQSKQAAYDKAMEEARGAPKWSWGDKKRQGAVEAGSALRRAKGQLETVVPQDVKFSDTLQRVSPEGKSRILASDVQKTQPGTRLTTGLGTPDEKTTAPAGEDKQVTPHVVQAHDKSGKIILIEYDPVTRTSRTIDTGVEGPPPNNPNVAQAPVHGTAHGQTTEDVLDEEGNVVGVKITKTDAYGKPIPGTSVTRKLTVPPPAANKMPPGLDPKNYKPGVPVSRSEYDAKLQAADDGTIVRDGAGKVIGIVVTGGDGVKRVQPQRGKVAK